MKSRPLTPIESCDLFASYIYHLYQADFYRTAHKDVSFVTGHSKPATLGGRLDDILFGLLGQG